MLYTTVNWGEHLARELKYDELKRFPGNELKKLKLDYDKAEHSEVLIGQEKAKDALKLGLCVKNRGYNIYVSGLKGTGRTYFAKTLAKQQAALEPVPNDLCYVYNFKEPKSPLLLTLKPKTGKQFKTDFEDTCSLTKDRLNKAFSERDFEDEKKLILKSYQGFRDEIMLKITDEAKLRNFGVKLTNTGIFFMPIVEGEPLSEEQFEQLSDDAKKDINLKSNEIHEQAADAMYEMREFESAAKKEISELEYRTAVFIIGKSFAQILEKYDKDPEIKAFLLQAKEHILDNYTDLTENEDEDEQNAQNALPWLMKKMTDNPLGKYKVNLFVDNSDASCAPVIADFNPTFTNLLGETEYDSEYGNLSTDYMKIKPGLLHKANGGYLILQEEDVLTNYAVWELIKKVAKTGEVVSEPPREFMTGITISGVKTRPVKLDIKFIIVGSFIYHELLSAYDADFGKYFKINAVFDSELNYSDDTVTKFISFIKRSVNEEAMPRPDTGAIAGLLEQFVRMTESKDKITASFNAVNDLLIESAYHAKLENSSLISAEHVKKAVKSREDRSNLYEEKLNELIEKNVIMIETEGKRVGQINGLSVISVDNRSFGKPSKITATVYMGKAGVVNIEKEAEMSGSIHNKGIEVITGYLGQKYAQEFPLTLSCRVCFEQNYGGIDGDSASSTELYCILSGLSGFSITQEIAVTGSVNQFGEIQAIGGVTAKIEGFYDLCKSRKLTGNQGVMIPEQNVGDLMLKDEIIQSVKNKEFHVYAIKTIDEGLEIMTGVKAGKPGANGKYPQNSVHGKAFKKLKLYHEKSEE